MESIRGSLISSEQTLTIDEHQTLFTSTSLFERSHFFSRCNS